MMRMNRVRWLMAVAVGQRNRPGKRNPAPWQWCDEKGLVSDWPVVLTEKGRRDLDVAINEHERHGNFKPR